MIGLPLCRRVGRWCWYGFVAALAVLALTMSLARSLLPQVDGIRSEILSWAEQRLELELALESLGAGWAHGGPHLTLRGLSLPPQEGVNAEFSVAQIELQLDFWATLSTLSPQLKQIRIQGLDLELDLQGGGEPEMEWGKLTPLRDLFLYQLGDLSIEAVSARLNWQGHALAPIHLSELKWQNRGQRHLGVGHIYLDEALRDDEQLTVAIELSSADPLGLKGRAYLNAEQLDLGDWLARRLDENPYHSEGVLNLQAWASIGPEGPGLIQLQLDGSSFSWHLEEQTHELSISQGRLQWRPVGSGGELQSQALQLVSDGVAWPQSAFALRHQSGDLRLWLDRLPLWGLQPLLALAPGLTAEQLAALMATPAEGTLGPLQLQQQASQWRLTLPFDGLGWEAAAGLPGLEGLSGELYWQPEWTRLSLEAQPLALDWPAQWPEPLQLSKLSLSAEWLPEQSLLRIPDLALTNDDLSAQLSAALALPAEGASRLQLMSRVALHRAGEAGHYFPRRAMGEGLSEYLAGALRAGRSDNVQLIWHGELGGYPYRDDSGRFLAGFTLEGLEFDFLEQWPAVTDATLMARFANESMDLQVARATLAGVTIEGAHVTIPTLDRSATLSVEGSLLAEPSMAEAVLGGTFLAPTVLGTLEQVQLQAPVPLSLDMTFPLGSEVADQSNVVKGRLAFWDTPVHLSTLDLDLEQVRGELRFSNSDIEADALMARIYNQPTELALRGGSRGEDYGIDIDFTSHWQQQRIPPALQTPLDPFITGGTRLDGQLALRLGSESLDYQAEIHSELTGLKLGLPGVLYKESDQPWSATLALTGDKEGSELYLQLAERAHFIGDLSYADGAGFDRYHLALDQAEPTPAERNSGLISLQSARIDLSEYDPLIRAFAEAPSRDDTARRSLLPPLDRIQIRADELRLLEQSLGSGSLTAQPNRDGWGIALESEGLRGEALVGEGNHGLGLQIQADYLHLNSAEPEPGDPDLSLPRMIGQVPALDVAVEALTYNGIALGRAQLQGHRDSGAYEITLLSLQQDSHQLLGSGSWFETEGTTQSRFEGQVTSPDVGALIGQFGFTPVIEDARTALNFDLHWPGAPWQSDLSTLEGELDYEITDGRMSDVSDRGARLLTLFSLESLMRRLSLDFSDVFSKGMHFRRFAGTLQFEQGVLVTDDSVMDANAGTMRINGQTDLNTRALDYQITFSPALTSNVPAVVFLSTGAWTVGLGAFAVSKFLEPVIEVITRLRYHLTGTLDEPELVEVERAKREIALPEAATGAAISEADAGAKAKAVQEALNEALDAPEQGGAKDGVSPAADEQPGQPGAGSGLGPEPTGESGSNP
ncbi:YhdP family protein [Ferrimonas gelatinilytica]|uniref:YhdP family protein n=1 Tax=Ferrimonas gelatinilytica TaxID=1255257 RepID=A0ABP9SFS7_9GAMM